MLLTLVGVFFILLDFTMPIGAVGTVSYSVDILPDFVGYLILWFSLEKPSTLNRWFKDSSTLATTLLALTFLGFLGNISFLLPGNSTDGSGLAFLFELINTGYTFATPLFVAANMVFLSFLSRALGSLCEERGREFLSTGFWIFTILFFGLAAFALVFFFFPYLPIRVWHIALPVGIVFGIFSLLASKDVKELQ